MLKNRIFYLFLVIFLFILVFFVISNPPSPGTINPVDSEESLTDSLDEYIKISTWVSCYDENRNSDIVVDSKVSVKGLPENKKYYHNHLTREVCFDYKCKSKNSCSYTGEVGLWGFTGPDVFSSGNYGDNILNYCDTIPKKNAEVIGDKGALKVVKTGWPYSHSGGNGNGNGGFGSSGGTSDGAGVGVGDHGHGHGGSAVGGDAVA